MPAVSRAQQIGQAGAAAGYSCAASTSGALRAVRELMPRVMDEVGLDDRKLVENYLKPLMDANETKFFAHDGEVKDQREVIAWGPRERGLDMAFKLRGSYAPAAVEHSGAIALPVVFALNVEFPDV